MIDVETIRSYQRAFLDQVKARKEPVVYTVEGVEIKVNPGVFPPAPIQDYLHLTLKRSQVKEY